MEEKLNRTVKEGRELIQDIPDQGNPKRKILLNEAKKAIRDF